jgi:hypothetical protein
MVGLLIGVFSRVFLKQLAMADRHFHTSKGHTPSSSMKKTTVVTGISFLSQPLLTVSQNCDDVNNYFCARVI